MNLEIPSEALLINQGYDKDEIEQTNILYARDHKLPIFTRYGEGAWKEAFYFIQITDLKIGQASSPEESWQEEIVLLKEALEIICKMKPSPRFVIFTGNLTSQSPGEKLYDAQVRDLKSTISTGLHNSGNSVPVVCIAGKSDIGSPLEKTNIEKYREHFGEDWFVFWVEGVQFIAINSTYYNDSEGVPDLKKEQDEWLESQLFEAQFCVPKHVIMFQSVPWFHDNIDENNDEMNIPVLERTGVIQKIKEAGVHTVIAGSMNKNNIVTHENIQLIVSNPLSSSGEKQPGFRVVKVLENHIEHEYYELKNIPSEIILSS